MGNPEKMDPEKVENGKCKSDTSLSNGFSDSLEGNQIEILPKQIDEYSVLCYPFGEQIIIGSKFKLSPMKIQNLQSQTFQPPMFHLKQVPLSGKAFDLWIKIQYVLQILIECDGDKEIKQRRFIGCNVSIYSPSQDRFNCHIKLGISKVFQHNSGKYNEAVESPFFHYDYRRNYKWFSQEDWPSFTPNDPIFIWACLNVTLNDSECASFTPSEDLRDFGNMLEAGTLSDFTIKVGDEDIKTHKFILAAKAKIIRDKLLSEEKVNVFPIEGICVNNFKRILKFLYTGAISFQNLDDIKELLGIAHKYGIESLAEKCCKVLRMKYLNADNAIDVLKISKSCDLEELYCECVNVIIYNIKKEQKYSKVISDLQEKLDCQEICNILKCAVRMPTL